MKWTTKAALVALLAIIWFYFRRGAKEPIRIQKHLKSTYDYIIVGGGSAGCVLANRLSEDPDVQVLVLEAGIPEYPPSEVPGNAMALFGSEIDWKYVTEPQPHCCGGFKNRVSNWPSGKVLGGSSTINMMQYLRGSPHDFDFWRDQGCEGWGYKDVLPYFLKAEDNLDHNLRNSGDHAVDGPTKLSTPPLSSIGEAFIQAGKELGYEKVDLNGKKQIGFGAQQSNINRGERSGAFEAYLRPVMGRKNLHVATGCFVTQVIFESTRATGVYYFRHGKHLRVNSRLEVILSAGTIRSPQILQLSGVGPQQELQKLNIPLLADLPVGQGLQNHLSTSAAFFTVTNASTATEAKARSFWTRLQYQIFRSGYMAGTGNEASALLRLESQSQEDKFPHLSLILMTMPWASGPQSYKGSKAHFNWKDDVFHKLHGDYFDMDGFSILPRLLHPYSKGSITLRSINPSDKPVIRTNTLKDKRDVQILVDGIKLAQKLGETEALKQVGAAMSERIHPHCKEHVWGSDDYWRCFVMEDALPIIGPTSTCKMGSVSHPDTVVDPQLRVKGLEDLRVVDASIIPHITSGSLYPPVLMIAEKAADLIKKSHAK